MPRGDDGVFEIIFKALYRWFKKKVLLGLEFIQQDHYENFIIFLAKLTNSSISIFFSLKNAWISTYEMFPENTIMFTGLLIQFGYKILKMIIYRTYYIIAVTFYICLFIAYTYFYKKRWGIFILYDKFLNYLDETLFLKKEYILIIKKINYYLKFYNFFLYFVLNIIELIFKLKKKSQLFFYNILGEKLILINFFTFFINKNIYKKVKINYYYYLHKYLIISIEETLNDFNKEWLEIFEEILIDKQLASIFEGLDLNFDEDYEYYYNQYRPNFKRLGIILLYLFINLTSHYKFNFYFLKTGLFSQNIILENKKKLKNNLEEENNNFFFQFYRNRRFYLLNIFFIKKISNFFFIYFFKNFQKYTINLIINSLFFVLILNLFNIILKILTNIFF
jgi:hypothetical protein